MRSLVILLAVAFAAADKVDEDHLDERRCEKDPRSCWPLIFAAGEGDANTVQALLAKGVDPHQQSKDGESALHVVCIKGSLETARLLLDAGADANARTPRGPTLSMTPAMWATYHANAALVEMLLDAGADPAAADQNGKTLLTMSQEAQQPEIEAMLRSRLADAEAR